MDINALLQMLSKQFGAGSGGQMAFAGGSPGFSEMGGQVQPGGPVQPRMSMPGMGGMTPGIQGTMGGMTGGNVNGGGSSGTSPMAPGGIAHSILQMMQRNRGRMNLG